MTRIFLSTLLLAGTVGLVSGKDHKLHTFKKIQVTDKFYSEGAFFGDFNKDGQGDLVSGPYWYEGPDFKKSHEIYPPVAFDPNVYSKNFIAYSYDINKDKWPDVVVIGFPGEDSSWYENPKGQEGHWKKHMAYDIVDNESPTFQDITGDGKPEIICNSRGFFGYVEPNWEDPTKMWTFHPISPKGSWQRFTHGIGIGDVNGDGRLDLLEKDGWWEQPKSLKGDPIWKKHNQMFGTGGAQMYAYDVDGDGDNDVITSLAAHGFGLAWYENNKQDDAITFKEHIIMNKESSENKYGVKFSQLHAIDLVDMDRDGLKDIVTGKRHWAHGPKGDPEPNASAVVYWFRLTRPAKGQAEYVPYLVDDNSGVGTQVAAGDVNGDKLPDIVVGNKKGTFVHLHEAKKVKAQEWENAQPKPYAPDRSAR